MAKEFRVVLVGDDNLTPVVDKSGKAFDELGRKIEGQSKLSENLTRAWKEERSEARMRNFALREGAGAVQQLSDVFVGPSGLGKNLAGTIGKFFEFDFALNTVAAMGESAGGTFGKLAGGIGAVALPASIAIGSLAMIMESIRATEEHTKKLTEANRDLSIELGLIPNTKLEDLRKKLEDINKEALVPDGFIDAMTSKVLWYGVLDEMLKIAGIASDLRSKAIAERGAEKTGERLKTQKEIVDEKRKELATETEIAGKQEELFKANLALKDSREYILPQEQKLLGFKKEELTKLEAELKYLKESNGEKTKILDLEIKIAKQKKDVQNQEKFVSRVSEAPESLAFAPLKLEVDKNLMKSLHMHKVASDEIEASQRVMKDGWEDLNQSIDRAIEKGQVYGRIIEDVGRMTASALGQSFKAILGIGQKEERVDLDRLRRKNRLADLQADKEKETLAQQLTEQKITREQYELQLAEIEAASVDRRKEYEQAWADQTKTVFDDIKSAWGSMWSSMIDYATDLLAQFLVDSALSSIASLLTAGATGNIFTALGAMIFHEGGTVPKAHSGAYVNADPNREFLVKVRGGETIRTESQEKELRRTSAGSGATINLNVGTAVGGRQFVRDALAELRRQTGLSIEELTQDRSSKIALGS